MIELVNFIQCAFIDKASFWKLVFSFLFYQWKFCETLQIIISFSPPCFQCIWRSLTLCECASAVVWIKSSTALFHCDDPYTSQLALVCRSPQTSPGMSNNKTLVCKSQYPVSVSGTAGAKPHLIIRLKYSFSHPY